MIQEAFLPWQRFQRQAREILHHHNSTGDPSWPTMDRYSYYEIMRAEVIIFTDQAMGQGS